MPLQAIESPPPRRWSYDRRLPMVDQVYDDLRHRIVSLELPPDHSLSRQELADYYGISKTPLRDAIRKLEDDGLLETFPQSKTVVTRIDIDVVRETQFLRTALESEIVSTLASASDKGVLAGAEECHQRLKWALDRDTGFEEFNRLDKAFHRALYAASSTLGLYELIDARSGQLDRIRRLHLQLKGESKSEQVVADHGRILDAILAGDADAARAALRAHLSGTLSRVEILRDAFPGCFT